MIFSIFVAVFIAISLWTINRFFGYGQKVNALLVAITTTIFIIHQILVYLTNTGVGLYGYKGVIGNIFSCCFLPMCYLTTRKLCHIKMMSTTTVCLFLLALLNIFSKITVYTDYIPVKQILDDTNIQFYSGGKYTACLEIFEMVSIFQLLWIFERTMKFGYRVRRDHLHITTKAMLATTVVLTYIVISILSLVVPVSYETHIKIGFIMQVVDFVCMTAIVVFIVLGNNRFFIADEHDEMVYFDEIPNYKKMKRQLDELLETQKIQRNEDLNAIVVARILNTNSLTISKMLKEECDMTFMAYIQKARVDDAMDLIRRNPDTPLSDIATTCGFNSAVNFTKAFRKVLGMTPSEWADKKE